MATIVIDPDGSNETIIESGRLDGGIDATKVHTGVSDWGARVSFDTTLKDRKGDRIHIDDGDFFFRGFLTDIETTQAPGTAATTVGGLGVEHDLERNDAEKTYTNILVHDALDDYFTNETGFTPTVTPQTADETTTGTQVQEASTTSEFNAITEDNLGDNDPFVVQSNRFELAQTGFFFEISDRSDANDLGLSSDSTATEGQAGRLEQVGDWVEWQFTPDYTMPAAQLAPTVESGATYGLRIQPETTDNLPGIEVTLRDANGNTDTYDSFAAGDWAVDAVAGSWAWHTTAPATVSDVDENIQHTLRVEVTEAATNGDYMDVDCAWFGDRRSALGTYNFDDADSDGNNTIAGPEEYPDGQSFIFDLAPSTWNITDGTLTIAGNDQSNDFRIQLRLNDQTWFPSNGDEDNTTSVTTDFGSEVGISVQGRVRLDRFSSDTTSSPRQGDSGQRLSSWDISIDGNDIPCINDKTYEGSDMDIVQELAREGRMRWHAPHRRDSKPVEVYPDGGNAQSKPDWTVISTTRRDSVESAANHVTVRGARDDDGNRVKITVSDSDSITADGQEHFDALRPRAENAVEVERLARQILKRKLRDFNVTAEREIASIDLSAGPAYPVTLPDGTEETIPSEEVHYSVEAGDVTGRVRFDLGALRLENQLGGAQSNLRDTQLSF